MQKSLHFILFVLLSLTLAACGDDAGDDGSSGSDRGGPDSLTGFSWTTDPITINGVQLQLSFEFTEDQVMASNTCNGDTTVTASAPVVYSYTASIPQGDSARTEEGDAFCEVSITATTFDFEIVDGSLVINDGMNTFTAAPAGPVAGLYGDWEVMTEIGTLTFSMGGGQLSASNACTNGLSASASVNADYTNFLEIQESAMGGDDSCSVTISAGTAEYRFEGDDLIVIRDGQETRFSR